MNKFKYFLLCIITFGIVHLIVKNKSKKQIINNKLTLNQKHNFNIAELISKVGGKQNILFISNTMSNVIFTLKNNYSIDDIELSSIKGIKVIMHNANGIILVVGSCAKKLTDDLNDFLVLSK